MKKLTLVALLAGFAMPGLAAAQSQNPPPAEITAIEQKMIDDMRHYGEICRGNAYVEPETQMACGVSRYLIHLLSASGLCFELRGDTGIRNDGRPHRCVENSVRHDEVKF